MSESFFRSFMMIPLCLEIPAEFARRVESVYQNIVC